MTLLFTLHHRNKENEPSSLNGNAPLRRLRDTSKNPYSKSYFKPPPSISNLKQAPRSTITKAPVSRPSTAKATTSKASNASLASIEEETSPTIRRILEATGCSSRQELLVMRAAQEQQVNTNSNRNGSKSTTNRNGSKKAATNQSKTAPNGTKNATNGAPNVAKTTKNGAKATNPKKKSKSKYFYVKYTLVALDSKMKMMSLISFNSSIYNTQLHYSFECIQLY